MLNHVVSLLTAEKRVHYMDSNALLSTIGNCLYCAYRYALFDIVYHHFAELVSVEYDTGFIHTIIHKQKSSHVLCCDKTTGTGMT